MQGKKVLCSPADPLNLFRGTRNSLRKKIKKRIKRPCKVSKLLTMQGLFFVSNKACGGYYVVLHNPCDTPVESGKLSENLDRMRLLWPKPTKYWTKKTSFVSLLKTSWS